MAETLVDKVENDILQYIIDNNLHKGDSIPHEAEFVEMFGVGRNVVRESLSRLKSLGVIESKKHSGMTVLEPSLIKNMSRLFIPQLISDQSFVEMLEFRNIIEYGLAPFIFSRIKDKDVEDLRKLFVFHGEASSKTRFEEELKFHSRIYDIANNAIAKDMIALLSSIFENPEYHNPAFSIYEKAVGDRGISVSHEDIFKSIEDRDMNRYLETITGHLMAYQMFVDDYRKRNNTECDE